MTVAFSFAFGTGVMNDVCRSGLWLLVLEKKPKDCRFIELCGQAEIRNGEKVETLKRSLLSLTR